MGAASSVTHFTQGTHIHCGVTPCEVCWPSGHMQVVFAFSPSGVTFLQGMLGQIAIRAHANSVAHLVRAHTCNVASVAVLWGMFAICHQGTCKYIVLPSLVRGMHMRGAVTFLMRSVVLIAIRAHASSWCCSFGAEARTCDVVSYSYKECCAYCHQGTCK